MSAATSLGKLAFWLAATDVCAREPVRDRCVHCKSHRTLNGVGLIEARLLDFQPMALRRIRAASDYRWESGSRPATDCQPPSLLRLASYGCRPLSILPAMGDHL